MTDTTIRVNFSDEEAGSEARSFDALPSGSYDVYITEIETRECGPQSKNPGKHYWNVMFTVDGGPHDGRVLFTNVMLFDGALYSLAQLLKATGHADALETGNVPGPDAFIGERVTVNIRKQKDTYKMEKEGTDEVLWKNEVKGIKAVKDAGGSSSGGGSLLP
jgi:hypothetical protein